MTLILGARLGPYEISGAIGAGGMGEVFRARDTKLNRDVAVTVPPAGFARFTPGMQLRRGWAYLSPKTAAPGIRVVANGIGTLARPAGDAPPVR